MDRFDIPVTRGARDTGDLCNSCVRLLFGDWTCVLLLHNIIIVILGQRPSYKGGHSPKKAQNTRALDALKPITKTIQVSTKNRFLVAYLINNKNKHLKSER